MVTQTIYYDLEDCTLVHNEYLAKLQNQDAELTRLREIEKAARPMVELFKDCSQVCFEGPEKDALEALRAALGKD